MDIKIIIAIAMATLGLATGIFEFYQMHWIPAISPILSGCIAAGMLLFGREFISNTYIGASLVLVVTLMGFYGLFFEQEALDLKLDEARFEVAAKLLNTTTVCVGIPNSKEVFVKAYQACIFSIQEGTSTVDF